MRKTPVIAAVIALGASAGPGRADPQDFASIERGRYLAQAADCGSCHTIPGSNHPFSGGRPIETPFGTLVSPNITPDRETGIGDWTDDEFDAAVRHGRSRNGARLYPAMPFPYYTRMSREDVADIRVYHATIEPVHKAVSVNRLPFPLNIRYSMTVWDKLYFKPGEVRGMESRRLSGAGPRPLRCVPHTEDLARRRQDIRRIARRHAARLDGARYHQRVGRTRQLVGRRHRHLSEDRAQSQCRGRWIDGGSRRAIDVQNDGRRYQGHGRISERHLRTCPRSGGEPGQERTCGRHRHLSGPLLVLPYNRRQGRAEPVSEPVGGRNG